MTVAIYQDQKLNLAEIVARSEYKNTPISATTRLKSFVDMSEIVRAGEIDGEICCIWGVIRPTLLSVRAYLWLLTTDQMTEHQFLLIRHSQVEVEKLLKEYGVIIGHCSPRQPKSVRWLKWLGARFGQLDELGRLPFEIGRG